jgi:multisubunit Na+/H+ antiporter MnhF subunit
MMEWTITLCFWGLSAAILLSLFRLARGPTLLDRILAFDLIATCAVGMTVLLSARWQTTVYLELILIFSLLGFVGTVAFVFHLHKTDESPSRSRGLEEDVTREPDSHDHL